jgi:hypothetical protein
MTGRGTICAGQFGRRSLTVVVLGQWFPVTEW